MENIDYIAASCKMMAYKECDAVICSTSVYTDPFVKKKVDILQVD